MANIQEVVSNLISEMFADIRQNARAEGHHVTGKTVGSLEQRYRKEDGADIFEVWGYPHIGALDTGSAPARKRVTDAEREEFIRNLTEWCRARGFPSGGLSPEQYRSAAKFLKWYIGKYGSRLYRTPSKQYRVIRPAVEEFERKLSTSLSAFYEAEITNKFSK